MSTYETAPSTILLATCCAACGRPLRDAASVEAGMGPDCREKYGYSAAQGPASWARVEDLLIAAERPLFDAVTAHWGDAHKAANVLVHHAACSPRDQRGLHVQVLSALGYVTLAKALAKGAGELVEVHVRGDRLAVKAPYNPAFNDALKAQRVGARWDKAVDVGGKRPGAWVVPSDPQAKRGLFAALKAAFAGAMLVSAKGVVQLLPPAPRTGALPWGHAARKAPALGKRAHEETDHEDDYP